MHAVSKYHYYLVRATVNFVEILLLLLLLLPGKGRNSMNECLCPVIKNSAGHREQPSLLCYIQLKVH